MRVRRHCCAVSEKITPEQWAAARKILRRRSCRPETWAGDYGLVFDIYEDDPEIPALIALLGEESFPYAEAEYEPAELETAPWVEVFSKSCSLVLADAETAFSPARCRGERIQTAPLTLASSKVNFRSVFFMSAADQSVTGFVRSVFRGAALEYGTKGVEFWPVYGKNGREPLGDCWQMRGTTVQRCVAADALLPDAGAACGGCGRRLYIRNARKELLICGKKIPQGVDLFFAGRITADDKGETAFDTMIVSQAFFRMITEKRLDKNLVFRPVKLC